MDKVRKRRGRKPVLNSARNGGERVVGIVSPDEAETVRRACRQSGLTRGEVLMVGAYHLLGMVDVKQAKDT